VRYETRVNVLVSVCRVLKEPNEDAGAGIGVKVVPGFMDTEAYADDGSDDKLDAEADAEAGTESISELGNVDADSEAVSDSEGGKSDADVLGAGDGVGGVPGALVIMADIVADV